MRHRALLVAVCLAATSLLWSGPALADTSPPAGVPETVTAEPLPTWQTNGEVWSVQEAGGVVYVGGRFTKVRPPGAKPGVSEVARRNLAAFDTRTGALLTWAPKPSAAEFQPEPGVPPDSNCSTGTTPGFYTCDTVWDLQLSPDRATLYVGGDFQYIDGKFRGGIAAFNRADGTLSAWKTQPLWGRNRAMTVSGSTVYAGGIFRSVNGVPRGRLAAFSRTSGDLLPWAPAVDRTVYTMAMAPDASRVVIGGDFFTVNGAAKHGVTAIDAVSGSQTRWDTNAVPDVTLVTDMLVDGDTVYVTGEAAGTVYEGVTAYDPYTGAIRWQDDCRGASWAVEKIRDVLYVGSHHHDCSMEAGGFPETYSTAPVELRYHHRLTAQSVKDGRALMLQWWPTTNGGTGGSLGPRDLTTDGTYLWVGGEFTTVDGKPQQGLTRFAFRSVAPATAAPRQPAKPLVSSVRPGEVTVTFNGTWDSDNENLTYQVIRDGNTASPVWTGSGASRPWRTPSFTFVDTAVAAGRSYRYQVRALDPHGTVGPLSTATTVTPATATLRYRETVLADGANVYWRLNETSGSSAADSSGAGFRGIYTSTAGRGRAGALTGDADRAVAIASGRRVGSEPYLFDPRNFSLELWFKTSGSGRLAGFGSHRSTNSTTYDRMLYLNTSGQLVFGMYDTQARTAVSSARYNDNRWHHVVATAAGGVHRLYVDGQPRASGAYSFTDPFNGYWRLGQDLLTGWPGAPSTSLAGDLDEFAVYPVALGPTQVSRHYAAGRGQ